MGDDYPWLALPDGTFDLCIERLGLAADHPNYPPNDGKWKGDPASWEKWKAWIGSQYAPGADLTQRSNRDPIFKKLDASQTLPYFDFNTGEIKFAPKP